MPYSILNIQFYQLIAEAPIRKIRYKIKMSTMWKN